MPGRQSTAPPSLQRSKSKSKSKKQKPKRALNALSIAEQQSPSLPKIRRNRLGESEPENKRKRQGSDGSEDEGSGRQKRRRSGQKDRFGNEVEVGSDSSGNEWVLGQADGDEDSELDSDEAMGESDEERFEGFRFGRGESVKGRRKGRGKGLEGGLDEGGLGDVDLREEGVEGSVLDEESDGFGEEGVDLAAVLDDEEEDDDGDEEEDEDGDDEPRKRAPGLSERENQDHSLDEEDATDDDSVSEDGESVLSYSDGEEDIADPAKIASLKAFASTMDKQNSTVLSAPGPNTKPKLTLADVMPFTGLQSKKSLKILAKNDSKPSSKRSGAKPVEESLPQRQQDRLNRVAAYDKSKETLNRWIDTVKHNRRAEHLSFPLPDPNAVVAQGSQRLLPTAQSKPMTDLEATIQTILQDSGLAPANGKSEEEQVQAFEELQTNKMPLAEVAARRAELRKARELLFREEIRAKRIKKIKSKTYRKVHRKERERMAQHTKDAMRDAGMEDSESEKERNDRRRAEERMGARHRESRWAKGVKDSGRAKWDEDARGGVEEMARREEELKRRIEGKRVAADEDDALMSESDADDNDDVRLRDIDGGDDELDSMARGSRLASMDFMKNAEATRRARNDANAEALRRTLAGEETPSEEEPEEGVGRKSYGPMKSVPGLAQRAPKEERNEFEEREGSDREYEDHEQNLENDDIEVVNDSHPPPRKAPSNRKPSTSEKRLRQALPTTSEIPQEVNQQRWSSSRGKDLKESMQNGISTDPLVGAGNPSEPTAKPRSAMKGSREAEKALKQSSHVQQEQGYDNDNENPEDKDHPLPFIFRNNNEDLIRQAFAGDNVEIDFTKEKEATIHAEQPKIIDKTLPGWGTWTGSGIGKKAQKRNKNKILVKEPGITPEKRKDAKMDRVIINEKRVKKNAKYLASSLPHPFETRAQYERSLRLPVGPEWTTKETFQGATKPRILMKQGIIAPMRKPII